MNWKRTLLYGVFVCYQLAAFAFTVLVDGHLDLLGLLRYIPYFKFITLIGLVLIILDISWYRKEKLDSVLQNDALLRENEALRKKLDRHEPVNKPHKEKV